MIDDLQIVTFASANEWEEWLKKHHEQVSGVWLRFYKKVSHVPTISYAEALDGALCYGWIDAQVKRYDELSYLQKFTPRRSKSIWSKNNIENVGRLIHEGKMEACGLRAVEAAKADGRWMSAYDSPKNMRMPEDFLQVLSGNKKAERFFKTLNKANLYAIAWRLQTTKRTETRQRKIESIIQMLEKGETFH